MRFIAPFLLTLASAAALAVPEARSVALKPWEVTPTAFEKVTVPEAQHEKPTKAQVDEKRNVALESRQAPFNYIVTSVLPYNDAGNTYYYLPYVAGTCFSFQYTNLDNILTGINILRNGVYCYFFVDYLCTYSDGYTYADYPNTPLNANEFQDNAWSSYVCYGV